MFLIEFDFFFNLLTNETQDTYNFSCEFYQPFKEMWNKIKTYNVRTMST